MKIKVTQILSLSQDEATSTLIQINAQYILVNCGLPKSLDLSVYQPYLSKISLIVLTSPSISHSGAFPFLPSVKTVTTTPIYYLFSINLYDYFQLHFPLDYFITYQKILDSRESIDIVKFNQKFTLGETELALVQMGHILGQFGLFWDCQGVTGAYVDEILMQQEWCLEGGLQDVSSLDFLHWNSSLIDKVDSLGQFKDKIKDSFKHGSCVIGVKENDRVLEILLELGKSIETWKQQGEQVMVFFYNNFKCGQKSTGIYVQQTH